MKFKILSITLLLTAAIFFAISCALPPSIPGKYETSLNLHIADTASLDSDDALFLMIVDGLLDLQDVNTTFNKDRTGFATTQLLGAPDTILFNWDYQYSEGVKIIILEDSTELILNYNPDGKCWQAALANDEAFTLFFTFTQL